MLQKTGITWRNSIFTKLIVTFLIIILPIYVLGILVFDWSRNMMTKQLFGTMQSYVQFDLNNFEEEINHIWIQQADCLYDEDLNSLAYAESLMSDYEKTSAVNRLQHRLTSIQNSSVFIKNVSAHILPLKLTVNAAGTNKVSTEEMNDDVYTLLSQLPAVSSSRIVNRDGRLILDAVFPAAGASRSPVFIVEVELSQNALRASLIRSDSRVEIKSMLESYTQNFVLSSDSDKETLDHIREKVREQGTKSSSDAFSFDAGGEKYLLIYAVSDFLDAVIARYIPVKVVFEPLKTYELWYWFFSILAVFMIILYSFSTYRFFQKPLIKLVQSFARVQKGDFSIQIPQKFNDEFRFLYASFNEMVSNLKILIEQVYQQKILTQRAELRQLQSQINPHFLYNSFFILQRRISRGDHENAERFCEQLGLYFKFITRNASDEVILQKEVEHAKIYADLQAARFSNRIQVLFDSLPEGFENRLVPRLILQPILENAFEHGLEKKEADGRLSVTIKGKGQELDIFIEDNGDQLDDLNLTALQEALMSPDAPLETTGLLNIHKRIRLTFGEESGLSVSRGTLGGLKVAVHLRFRDNEALLLPFHKEAPYRKED